MYHVQYSDYTASFFFSVQSAGQSSRDLIYIDIDLYRDKHVLFASAYRKSHIQRNFLDDKSTSSMLERPMSFYKSQKVTYKYLKNSMQIQWPAFLRTKKYYSEDWERVNSLLNLRQFFL